MRPKPLFFLNIFVPCLQTAAKKHMFSLQLNVRPLSLWYLFSGWQWTEKLGTNLIYLYPSVAKVFRSFSANHLPKIGQLKISWHLLWSCFCCNILHTVVGVYINTVNKDDLKLIITNRNLWPLPLLKVLHLLSNDKKCMNMY